MPYGDRDVDRSIATRARTSVIEIEIARDR
jgi:hypothetical protein